MAEVARPGVALVLRGLQVEYINWLGRMEKFVGR
jgi:hypothetical protein